MRRYFTQDLLSYAVCDIRYSACVLDNKTVFHHRFQRVQRTDEVIKLFACFIVYFSCRKYIFYAALACKIADESGALRTVLIVCVCINGHIRIAVHATDRHVFAFSDESAAVCSAKCNTASDYRDILNLRPGCAACQNGVIIFRTCNLRIADLYFRENRACIIISCHYRIVAHSADFDIRQVQAFKDSVV